MDSTRLGSCQAHPTAEPHPEDDDLCYAWTDAWNQDPPAPTVIDAGHLQRQIDWSSTTFGPGPRADGIVDHIRKELNEILDDPTDLFEWVDVMILALDGAWRDAGASPQEIIDALIAKQTKNEGRVWPDWRTAEPGKAIEHDRSHD